MVSCDLIIILYFLIFMEPLYSSIFYGIVLLVGIIGNILVVTVVMKSRKMKSLPYLFIANLAVSDLMANFLCLPFTLMGSLLPGNLISFYNMNKNYNINYNITPVAQIYL